MLLGIQWLEASLTAVLGLLIGSFLNVVIYRIPKILDRQWAAECAEIRGDSPQENEPFNLMLPRSRCPHCGHQIQWYENIPILSYLALRGACSKCRSAISPRYPAIEAVTSALFALCGWRWGLSITGLAWATFGAILLALAFIDWDTTLLPDDLTLPLLWLGLAAAALKWTPVGLESALWGAMAGYLSLWLVYWAFKLITGREGMGYGDFKLLAGLGAWFGWQALIPMVLLASSIGILVWLIMKLTSSLREGSAMPFGPLLAGAGFAALILGPDAMRQAIGIL